MSGVRIDDRRRICRLRGLTMRCIYRNFGGETIALWPDEIADLNGNCLSYLHVGQHGVADFEYVMKNSKPATREATNILRDELLMIGYSEDEC